MIVDERFVDSNVVSKLSKWMRGCVRSYADFQNALHDLEAFFVTNTHHVNNQIHLCQGGNT